MNNGEHLVEFTKLGENANLIKLASAYDTNCSNEEYTIVNDEVLELMLQSDRAYNALARRERYHAIPSSFDDEKISQRNLDAFAVEEQYSFLLAEEDELFQEQLSLIQTICSELTDVQRDRLYIHCVYGMNLEVIASFEGVSIEAVSKSCEIAKQKLQKHRHFLLSVRGGKWAHLLKSPNFKKYSNLFPAEG